MSEDMSAMIRTGVTLVLVAALISAVLNIVSIATTAISTGMNTLQSGVGKLNTQEFETYNQTTLTGTEVLSALNLYNNRDVAVCIQTNTLRGSAFATANEGKGKYHNYGPLVGGSAATPEFDVSSQYDADKARLVLEFVTTGANNDLVYNTSYKPAKQKGDKNYVNPTGKFLSKLIYDSSGDIIGIAFQQK